MKNIKSLINNYQFCCPTKLFIGQNNTTEIGKIISQEYGFHKIFLVYGSDRIKKNGIYQIITQSLEENQISYDEYCGVEANPDIKVVRKIVERLRAFNPELILAIGGGSVIDTCKSAAHGYYYNGDPLDFNKHKVRPLNTLKVGVILTIAASGSEMSDSCVISDREKNFKGGFNDESNYPLFAILDPTMTYSLPKKQLAFGLIDMFSHSFERFFSPSEEYEVADYLALATMRAIIDISKSVLTKENDYSSRKAMMLLGAISHNGITNVGKTKRFIVHQAEHYLSGIYPDLIHGQGIALLLPSFIKTNSKFLEEKILLFNQIVFSQKDASEKPLLEYISSLPIVHSFSDLDFEIKAEDITHAEKMLHIR